MIMIIILAYIISIFVNRYFNKIMYKQDKTSPILPFLWFIPLLPTITFLFLILQEYEFKKNWWNGKNW